LDGVKILNNNLHFIPGAISGSVSLGDALAPIPTSIADRKEKRSYTHINLENHPLEPSGWLLNKHIHMRLCIYMYMRLVFRHTIFIWK